MGWRILGPVQTWNGHDWLPVPAGKQRELVAILLLHPGRVLERDWLIETLWDRSPPRSALRLLPHYVWRLRGLLASQADRLCTVPTGYVLSAAPEDLDYARFAELHNRGRAALRHREPEGATSALTEALGLWRGPALADARTLPILAEAAQRLDQQRIDAQESLAEALLASGRPAEAISAAQDLTAAEPFRETPWRLLMTALYRAGRRPDALGAYRRLWRTWTDQLGIEPSQELHELHQRILADDHGLAAVAVAAPPETGPARVTPRQLPPAVRQFVGRADELRQLDNLVEAAANTGGTVVISAIDGTAGIGKTALALHWARLAAGRFPHGQLYTDLRGYDPAGSPQTPAEAIRGFLDAFAVPADQIPAGLDSQIALYRSLVAGRRMLVVLDNARDTAQVRPLLPGTPTCMVVVTSRSDLSGLVALDGAHPITLDLLSAEEARELLALRLGRRRLDAEPAAVADLVVRCARLPLALAIAAARAAADPATPLRSLAAELDDQRRRLATLDTDDPGAQVRTVFATSYQRLSAPAARLFRLIGLHPGPDVSVPAAASLAGIPLADARTALAELTRAHLLLEQTPARYTFHDLLRAYAADLAHDQDSDRRNAIRRLMDHYLHAAHAAARLLNPNRDPIILAAPADGTSRSRLATYEQAMAWFTVEHRALVAVVLHAHHAGLHTHAWQLAWTLADFLHRQGRWHERVAVERSAIAAAAAEPAHPLVQARTHVNLADAYTELSRFDDAYHHLVTALELAGRAGDTVAQAQVHLSLEYLLGRQDRNAEALANAQQAHVLFQAAGHRVGQANALNGVAWSHAKLGHHRDALTYGQRALALYQDLDHRRGQADAWDTIGRAHLHLGQYGEALTCYQSAVQLFRQLGFRSAEANTLNSLGDTHVAAGNPTDARAAWQQALDIFDELGHPNADQVRAKLDVP
jgi:DNA-binding SARP family transcriptional activator